MTDLTEVDVSAMTNQQLAEHLFKQKDHYDKLRKYIKQLEQKSFRSEVREKRLVHDHQKAVLQQETLNMMTKYQLVFAKIECQVNRILNSNKLRNLRVCGRAFERLKANAIARQKFTAYRANLIYLRLQDNLGSRLIARYQQITLQS